MDDEAKFDTTITTNDPPLEVAKTPVIYKKREYLAFKRLIQQGKFTTAYMTAKALNVDVKTIQDWLTHKQVRESMSLEVDNYVNKISQAKDWKAQAYLLDKVTNQDNQDKNNQTNLVGLNIVINQSK